MTPKNDFEAQVIGFMARIDEHMENQNKRCDNHAARLNDISARTADLEATRNYAKGILKAMAIGIPAFGSVAWFVYEFGAAIKSIKGGG